MESKIEGKKKTGFVVIVGNPNSGKSTLLNRLVGAEISIVTPKAQTTRTNITGILNLPDAQIIFVDTPGVLRFERNLLEKRMQEKINSALLGNNEVTIVLVDPTSKHPLAFSEKIENKLKEVKNPIIAINKIDLCRNKKELLQSIEREALEKFSNAKLVHISALRGEGIEALIELIKSFLEEGPLYYSEDQITSMPSAFFVSEIIRKEIFLFYKDEIPYETAVEITRYEDKEDKLIVEANIYVARPSQKGIIIGKKGGVISNLTASAKAYLENFFKKSCILKLHVGVWKAWNKSPNALKKFLYY